MCRTTRCTAWVRPTLTISRTSVPLLPGLLVLLLCPIVPSLALARSTGFIENKGQADPRVLYYVRGSSASIYFTREGVVVDILDKPAREIQSDNGARHASLGKETPAKTLRGRAVWARFDGAYLAPRVEARRPLDTKYHFLLGDDPAMWRTDVRAYREIVYHDIRPGVSVVFRVDNGRISYEVDARPGVSTDDIRFTVEGADETRGNDGPASAGGDHAVGAAGNPVFLARTGNDGGGFFERNMSLDGGPSPVDDPGFLSWSTFLGGGDLDGGVDIALDSSGNIVVLGETYSVDFPPTPGSYDVSFNGWVDMFVGKLSADGSTLLWCTFLGSSDGGVADVPVALALDASGHPVVTGYSALGYPVTVGAYDTTWNGGDDVVVTKLSPDGSSLLWSTFLGGSDYDFTDGLALDASGNSILTGATYSPGFPTTPGAYDPTYAPSGDIFVSKLSSNGSTLLWSTFVGGGEGGTGLSVAIDASENPVVTGYASSGAFPVTPGVYDVTWNGMDDVFVSKLSSNGSSLLWSTFLGGDSNDEGVALALDPSGRVVVAGNTRSANFPTTPGVYQKSWKGGDDVFVAMLSSSGTSLVWSTFLGGSDNDRVWDCSLDSEGRVVLAGMIFSTGSSNFPTTYRTFDGSFNGGGLDAFVSTLWSNGGYLAWSSFLGGDGADEVRALVLDSFDDPVLTGTTDSSNFPTTPGAHDTSLNGSATDSFILRFDLEDPTGIEDTMVPSLSSLLSCAPNPFAQTTRIRYVLDRETDVDLRIFDVLGRVVGVIERGRRPAGSHEAMWDGQSVNGDPVATGVYFIRLIAGGRTVERKIAVIR